MQHNTQEDSSFARKISITDKIGKKILISLKMQISFNNLTAQTE